MRALRRPARGRAWMPHAFIPHMDPMDELAHAFRARLVERARDGEAGGSLEREVRALVENEAAALPDAEREALVERVIVLATGLGPLEPLLADASVDEVMVNGPGAVYVERHGRLERVAVEFAGEAELMHAIERVLAPLGRRVDEASPLCDARLPDGSRVNVVIPPLSLSGPCLTVRRFRHQGFSLRELVAAGTLPGDVSELLALCVAARAAVLVSGGTGSGKTTTLNALSGAIPGEERIVTIEDAAELRLRQRHVVRLEARPAKLEGRGEVTIRQLVRNALRMPRPHPRGRGPRPGGARHVAGSQHRTRRLTDHGARQLAGRRGASPRDARVDGGHRPSGPGGARAGGQRPRPGCAPGPALGRLARRRVRHRGRARSGWGGNPRAPCAWRGGAAPRGRPAGAAPRGLRGRREREPAARPLGAAARQAAMTAALAFVAAAFALLALHELGQAAGLRARAGGATA